MYGYVYVYLGAGLYTLTLLGPTDTASFTSSKKFT